MIQYVDMFCPKIATRKSSGKECGKTSDTLNLSLSDPIKKYKIKPPEPHRFHHSRRVTFPSYSDHVGKPESKKNPKSRTSIQNNQVECSSNIT